MWMTIYNKKNVRKKILLHFNCYNDKKNSKKSCKRWLHTPLFILFQAEKWDDIAENNHSFVN